MRDCLAVVESANHESRAVERVATVRNAIGALSALHYTLEIEFTALENENAAHISL